MKNFTVVPNLKIVWREIMLGYKFISILGKNYPLTETVDSFFSMHHFINLNPCMLSSYKIPRFGFIVAACASPVQQVTVKCRHSQYFPIQNIPRNI